MKLSSKQALNRRHLRVRRKVSGSASRPRLMVRKTLKHLYAQIIDDSPETGCLTIAQYGTATKGGAGKHHSNVSSAQELGKAIGEDLKKRGLETVVFDRGGHQYHGVVKALADSVRETGIRF